MLSRRYLGVLAAVGLGATGSPVLAQTSRALRPVYVTQTFVRALPDRRDQLGRFLELNWLAMDRRGIETGIFTHATLFTIANASGEMTAEVADFVVEVGYLTLGGYADVETKFNEIRKQHKVVLVEGLGFRELGKVVGDRQLHTLASA